MSALRISVPGTVRLVDLGPAACTVRGLAAVARVIAQGQPMDADATPAGPVERRTLSPAEMAAMRERDHLDPAPKPKPVRGLLTEADLAERAARRLRGGESTREAMAQARPCPHISDWVVTNMIRATGGNVTEASRVIRVPNATLQRRVHVMRRRGLFPDDVMALLDGKRPRPSRRVAA